MTKENSSNHGCSCGYDHDYHEEEMEIVVLESDDGEEECGILGVFGIEDQEYIALLSLETEDVFIYRYAETENGEFELGSIESEEEYDRVGEVFNTLFVNEEEEEN